MKGRMTELRKDIKQAKDPVEVCRLTVRLNRLGNMYKDVSAIARLLEHYYEGGFIGMENIAFRETKIMRVADLQMFLRETAATNDDQIRRLKKNMAIAIEQDLTNRQRQMLSMYYFDGKSMVEIGHELSVNKSTVSRTIGRAVRRLYRALKYSF